MAKQVTCTKCGKPFEAAVVDRRSYDDWTPPPAARGPVSYPVDLPWLCGAPCKDMRAE